MDQYNLQFLEEMDRQKQGRLRPKQWVYVPYDQLSLQLNPEWLLLPQADRPGLILLESCAWYRSKPFHLQRLALLSANQRFFALEALTAGFTVDYLISERGIAELLTQWMIDHQCFQIAVRTPAEYALREELQGLFDQGHLIELRHSGFLSEPRDFQEACGEQAPWRMDAFYRWMRKKLKLFITPQGKPLHGKWSMDSENRLPWKGEVPAPPLLEFDTEHWIKKEVEAWLMSCFTDHPGKINWRILPCRLVESEQLWEWAKSKCLPHFGPYEDAMHDEETSLFHTRISAVLNLSRLLPMAILQDCLTLQQHIPYPSLEGFIRQIIGWREFVFQVHWHTHGFRKLSPSIQALPSLSSAYDGGWYAYQRTALTQQDQQAIALKPKALATPNFLGAKHPLPAVYWGQASPYACLNHVVKQVMDEAWSHHITRLMVLSNWATLLGVEPRMLSDWFWINYIDAFDWVVEPNVLGMGTFALGELMTTKPYISGASYIQKMSNYCQGCQYDPKTTCPMTRLYWRFIKQNLPILEKNPRMSIPISALKKRSAEEQLKDEEAYHEVCLKLGMTAAMDSEA